MIKETIPIWITKEKRTYHLSDSSGNQADISNAEQLFNFLLIDADKPFTCKIVWNLYQIWDIMKSLLPSSFMDELDKSDRAFFGDYKVFSSSGKVLSIGYKPHLRDNFYGKRIEINVYSLRQYFPDDKVSNLNELNNKTKELMETLASLGWEVNSLSSAIAIYDSVLEKQYVPTIYTMPENPEVEGLLDYCYKMLCREWRTIYKVSHFQNAFHYDICGSYPSIIKDFYDTDECKVWYAKSFQKCDFGMVQGEIDITSDYCPIVNQYGENRKGKYEDVFSTEQIGFLYHYNQGTFKINDGFFVNFNKEIKPFYEPMVDLYAMRDFGGLRKNLSKGISVGIYGRMSEEHEEKYGKLFHPLYSVLTTSRTSIKVAKFILENHIEDGLISVIVDGLMNTKQVPCENNKEFGSWRSEQVNALVLSIGHQYFQDKKDSSQNTYESMMNAIKEHPNKSMLNDILLNKNMMVTHRNYPQYPKRFGDLLENIYNSEPIHV